MRFTLIDRAKRDFPVQRLCRVLGVSASGYFAWRSRLPSQRQRQDMVLLAHVRLAFALSNGTYGSPRMTRELRDQGLAVGRRRTARLMRGLSVILCARRCLSSADEPFAEDHGELGFCLGPLARRAFPFPSRGIEGEV